MKKIITVHYTSNGIPLSGLTPIIDMFELDVTNPNVNTHVVVSGNTTEIGNGWYRYDFYSYDPTKNYVFSFDGGGLLSGCDRYKHGGNESYLEDIAPAVWNQETTNHFAANTTGLMLSQIKADTLMISISESLMTSLLNTLLKYQQNRTKIDVANAQLIIYDNDGTTPLTKFNLKDFNGMSSVAEVCERIPVLT